MRYKHCHKSDHEVDECFKLHGVPEWYRIYKEKIERYPVNYAENSDDSASSYGGFEQRSIGANISKLVKDEISKYMSALNNQNGGNPQGKNDVNLVQKVPGGDKFDGHYAFNIFPSMERNTWIIDSGAGIHICSNPNLLVSIYELERPSRVHLPYGTSKITSYGGTAWLNNDLVLTNVLYIPEITNNLISIAQLVKEVRVRCEFYKTHCVFKTKSSQKILGVGHMKGNLYIFETLVERHFCNLFKTDEWHIFLGYPLVSTMKCMKFLTTNLEEYEAIRNCEICIRAK